MGVFWVSLREIRKETDWLVDRIRSEQATTMVLATFCRFCGYSAERVSGLQFAPSGQKRSDAAQMLANSLKK